MNLPNAENVRIDREKVEGYLLNLTHRFGRPKAIFFLGFGFSANDWTVLAAALRDQGQSHPVASITDTFLGPRFTVEGPLDCPDGRKPLVRTVWQFDNGRIAPRLITAYPLE